MLSAAFAHLNAKLHMPPFSLFMIALSLTDGMYLVLSSALSGGLNSVYHTRHDDHVLPFGHGYWLVARDWSDDQLFRHCVVTPRLGCWYLCTWRMVDASVGRRVVGRSVGYPKPPKQNKGRVNYLTYMLYLIYMASNNIYRSSHSMVADTRGGSYRVKSGANKQDSGECLEDGL